MSYAAVRVKTNRPLASFCMPSNLLGDIFCCHGIIATDIIRLRNIHHVPHGRIGSEDLILNCFMYFKCTSIINGCVSTNNEDIFFENVTMRLDGHYNYFYDATVFLGIRLYEQVGILNHKHRYFNSDTRDTHDLVL